MSKRNLKDNNVSSPAKRQRVDGRNEARAAREQNPIQNVPQSDLFQNDDIWGDDFGEAEIEKMDIVASQATEEEAVFKTPMVRSDSTKSTVSTSSDPKPSTSSGVRGGGFFITSSQSRSGFNSVAQSQMLASSDIDREIIESTQAIMFDDFENDIKGNSHNSTFRSRQETSQNSVVLVTDDEQVERWKEEKKKLLEDFMTKEGETEFLRQQLNQIQTRAENEKKEKAILIQELEKKYKAEIDRLLKEKSSLESQMQYQTLQFNDASAKSRLRESGSVKFAQPQANVLKTNKDRSINASMSWTTPKRVKTKESGTQIEKTHTSEILKTNIVQYPLKIIPQCIFEPPEPEKSVVEIKIEEKIGKRNLAIIQEEETFRIFENPELSKPKTTTIDGKILSTEFFLPDLGSLMNKTSDELNSSSVIPIINKLVATSRELLLNSTIVLQNIAQALQNDDIRDMNEIYLSEFYEMPVPHTRSICEARPWYLADYVAGNHKLKLDRDHSYAVYANQLNSYNSWHKKGFDFEFLDMATEFVAVVGTIRRSHQFSGLINAIMILIANVQDNVGFPPAGIKRVCSIFKEVIYSRPVLACFMPVTNTLKEFSQDSNFVSKLCIGPEKSGINLWKGSFNFTPDACALEIFIAQLDYFKLDPITLINITKDLASFCNKALLNNSIPWLQKTSSSCNCCLNLLKFVVINLYECSKINVKELKNKYNMNDILWRISKHEVSDKKHKINWNNELSEDWSNFEKNNYEDFWETLKTSQYCAIAYGIRLLSFLAKRDLDFMIRLTYIEDAFHLFLNNIDKKKDLRLKTSDEIALDIVKKTFVLEKNKEDNKLSQQLDVLNLENEMWTDFKTQTSQDLTKLYEDSL
ncbi:uncharacterized protein LOC100679381 isoform X2 [Nasonia vitripennis]|uniref:ATR-interacting protein mus304 n=1 Tax=Nasonia vitripennis TaxID=7425 RepID=A0A7M7M1I9_NASVI|nr:uncharacterized protein LOC100679381 isoform X2 [Nasonia vitripennis]